ncbi:developmentally-regulated gtp-binding protein 2 [Moniliophthora roreri]|nr:developmentally-regulated gtp-binding protein 2 [Moniliophthora roreri]
MTVQSQLFTRGIKAISFMILYKYQVTLSINYFVKTRRGKLELRKTDWRRHLRPVLGGPGSPSEHVD